MFELCFWFTLALVRALGAICYMRSHVCPCRVGGVLGGNLGLYTAFDVRRSLYVHALTGRLVHAHTHTYVYTYICTHTHTHLLQALGLFGSLTRVARRD